MSGAEAKLRGLLISFFTCVPAGDNCPILELALECFCGPFHRPRSFSGFLINPICVKRAVS